MCLIIVYDNHTDFINDFNRLQKQYEASSDFIYITVDLKGIQDVRVEIDFIKRQSLLSFDGFKSSKLIKVSLKSSFGLKSNITYRFKSNYLYEKFHRELRLIEWR